MANQIPIVDYLVLDDGDPHLEANECTKCGALFWDRRNACGRCANREFTKTLGKVLHRPTIFPIPGFAARLALGEMANDLLLASARVLPRKLQQSGFQFEHPELDAALREVLR